MKQSDPQLLIILTAPSGAGKTTIAHALLKEMPELGFTISATTRAPRSGEINGQDYYFLKVEEFEQKIAESAFIEYEMVYPGKYYGTLYSELERIWQLGKTPLRVVDVIGAIDLKEEYGSCSLAIFIRPPSMQSLRERLLLRGTENEQALEERIKRAHMEMEFAPQFGHVIINDNLPEAIRQTKALIKSFLHSKASDIEKGKSETDR